MRLVFALGRLSLRTQSCARPPIATASSSFARPPKSISRLLRPNGRSSWHRSTRKSKVLIATGNAAALGTAAFVELAGNGDGEKTGEGLMLEVSREEIKDRHSERRESHYAGSLSHITSRIIAFLDSLIWEPVFTGLRFLQLTSIFVPVILSVPVVWIGRRQPDRDNERLGTLWWYGFLVRAMEWAGPAFIKVWPSFPWSFRSHNARGQAC